MKFSRQFSFALTLIKSHFFQYSLAIFGIFIGTASVFFFLSLTQGIKNGVHATMTTSENILTVQPQPQKLKIFQKKLDKNIQKKLKKIQGVETVYTEITLMVPSRITLKIPLFGDMKLDFFFVRGVDNRFFKTQKFHSTLPKNTTPVILSPLSLNLLNSFSDSIPAFPGIKKKDIEHRVFSIEVGKSVSFPFLDKNKSQEVKVFVSGFSSMAPLLGTMMSQSKAEELARFFGIEISEFSRLHVKVGDNMRTSIIKQKIEKLGFSVVSQQAGDEKISQSLFLLQGVFLISSGLILLLSILFLFSLLTLSVVEHHKTIGVLRSLGASKLTVRTIFLLQGSIISFLGSGLGMLAGGTAIWAADRLAQKNIPHMAFFPESLFSTSPLLIIGLFFGIIAITLFSTWIPANRAAKKDPLLLLLE